MKLNRRELNARINTSRKKIDGKKPKTKVLSNKEGEARNIIEGEGSNEVPQ